MVLWLMHKSEFASLKGGPCLPVHSFLKKTSRLPDEKRLRKQTTERELRMELALLHIKIVLLTIGCKSCRITVRAEVARIT